MENFRVTLVSVCGICRCAHVKMTPPRCRLASVQPQASGPESGKPPRLTPRAPVLCSSSFCPLGVPQDCPAAHIGLCVQSSLSRMLPAP